MNWFSSVITAVCTAGICFGALFMISPTGKTGKSVQYIISLCFLLIIISAVGVTVRSADIDIDFKGTESVDTTELQINSIKHTCGLALQKAGIDFKEISVSVDISANGSIECTKVTVNSAVNREKILDALGGEREDFKVEVINE